VRLAQGQIRFVVADHSHVLIDMLNDEDPEKSERVMKAMLQMQKIDIKTLKHAYERQRRSCAASMRLADHAKS